MIRWGLAVAITVLSARVTNAQPVPRTLTYCTRGDTSLRLDLYMPERVEGPVPVVLALFGGSGYFGDRGLFQRDSEYIELRTRLLEKGMAVAAPDYRLRTRWQAGIQDARCAVRYLRANASTINIDPARIAATGISWGGQLALLLALGGSRPDWDSGEHMEQSSKVQAVAAFVANPAAEQKSLHDHGTAAIAKDVTPTLFQQVSVTVFGTLEPVPDYAPNTHVRPGAPPVFLALGLNDSWVHIDHGTVFMRSLATAKVPSTLVYVPSGHEGTVRLAAREASDFLIRALMAAGR